MTLGAGRAARNLSITAALVDVVKRCAAVGVRTLPLKGGALLAAGIVAPHERHLDDLDLWVAPGQARAAFDLLTRAGYRADASAAHDGADGLEAPTHQLPILRAPWGAIVELHLESHAHGEAGDFDACWRAGVDVVVGGVAVRVPCPRHLLEQLCGHVVVHHMGEQRYWPRHVDDVRRLVARHPELAALRARPDEVGLSLRVAHGVDVPDSADAWLGRVFLTPAPLTARLLRAAALGARTLRFVTDEPGGFAHVLVPTAAHLRFTGDLRGNGAVRAHLRRWRRILGRL